MGRRSIGATVISITAGQLRKETETTQKKNKTPYQLPNDLYKKI